MTSTVFLVPMALDGEGFFGTFGQVYRELRCVEVRGLRPWMSQTCDPQCNTERVYVCNESGCQDLPGKREDPPTPS